MVLKFPSGLGSVSIQDLGVSQRSQPSCLICHKHWVFRFHACLKDQLNVLHPCQHLVGSGCWETVPDEQKGKCPVCKVKISSIESVQVYNRADDKMSIPSETTARPPTYISSKEMKTMKEWREEGLETLVRHISFREKKMVEERTEEGLETLLRPPIYISSREKKKAEEKKKTGLNHVDVAAIMYYMNLRGRLESVKLMLGILLASTKALTPTHLAHLVFFLTHTPPDTLDSPERKITIALHAFNICHGTKFSLGDLREALFSVEDWIMKHFAAILHGNEEKVVQAERSR